MRTVAKMMVGTERRHWQEKVVRQVQWTFLWCAGLEPDSSLLKSCFVGLVGFLKCLDRKKCYSCGIRVGHLN